MSEIVEQVERSRGMEKKDYEEIEKNADILQKNASDKCNHEIQKAQNFYNGYQQGIEDLLKSIRR